MREIEFKGQRVDNGEWIYGLLTRKHEDFKKVFIDFFPNHDDNQEYRLVIPETVGQYTGLNDKNGVKIFEGDVVKITDNYMDEDVKPGEVIHIGKVQFGSENWVYPAFNIDGFENDDVNSFSLIYESGEYNIEVIGNIYDNPELMEV